MFTSSSRKQNSSSKQDIASKNLIDFDPKILPEILRAFWEKPIKTRNDLMPTKLVLDDLLRTENITRKEYNIICKKN